MSSHIVTDFELSIKEGKLDDFKAIVNTMIEMTDVNEPNTLVYEWYINGDGSECHLLETFKDSDAFMSTWETSATCLTQFLDSRP